MSWRYIVAFAWEVIESTPSPTLERRYYSRIYWHFTGGPRVDWTSIRRPSNIKVSPQGDDVATDTLKKILSSRMLKATATQKIGGYQDSDSPSFCCVCDIPFKDLPSHAMTYGRVAIGFHADSIHRAGFNPVFYVSYDRLFQVLRKDAMMSDDHALSSDLAFESDEPIATFFGHLFAPALAHTVGTLAPYVKVTEFSADDEKTFYREREWRHISNFVFEPDDVAALLVPETFVLDVRNHLREHDYAESTPVIPWELVLNV